jgi:hypothetical protein
MTSSLQQQARQEAQVMRVPLPASVVFGFERMNSMLDYRLEK